jgi:hypothetical protein
VLGAQAAKSAAPPPAAHEVGGYAAGAPPPSALVRVAPPGAIGKAGDFVRIERSPRAPQQWLAATAGEPDAVFGAACRGCPEKTEAGQIRITFLRVTASGNESNKRPLHLQCMVDRLAAGQEQAIGAPAALQGFATLYEAEKKEVLDAFEKAGIAGGGTGAPAAAPKAAKKKAPKESERRAAVRARWSALVRAR